MDRAGREVEEEGPVMARNGITGGEAMKRQLDDVAARIGGHRKTFLGRLHYMTRSAKGRAVLAEHGLDVTPRTMGKWLAGGKASKANRLVLDQAYENYRRENVVRAMKTRLNKGGSGTRIEIHPVVADDPSKARANVTIRHRNIRNWDDIVDAWESGDDDFMDAYWDDVSGDESPPDAYAYVSYVGF